MRVTHTQKSVSHLIWIMKWCHFRRRAHADSTCSISVEECQWRKLRLVDRNWNKSRCIYRNNHFLMKSLSTDRYLYLIADLKLMTDIIRQTESRQSSSQMTFKIFHQPFLRWNIPHFCRIWRGTQKKTGINFAWIFLWNADVSLMSNDSMLEPRTMVISSRLGLSSSLYTQTHTPFSSIHLWKINMFIVASNKAIALSDYIHRSA